MERCKLCNGRGHIVIKGKEVICRCRLVPNWKLKLGSLVYCGKVSTTVKQVAKELIKESPVAIRPRHYYIRDSNQRTPQPRKWYKGFLAYYLVKSMDFINFKYVEFSMLNEAFFSDKSTSASMSDEVRYFDLSQKTLVLVCNSRPSSRISEDILRTFLDTYMDRNIFIYFSMAAQKGVKKPEWDGKKMSEVQVIPGLHHVVMTEPYAFIDVCKKWGL